MLPKSILKKTKQAFAEPPAAVKTPQERNREIAVHHATLIQQQKEIEAEILQATIELLDFPANDSADPALPSPEEASQFCKLVIPFQPSDYDALLEERHAADRCGYALCPRPPKKSKIRGKLCFVETEQHGVQIVPRHKVEIWCSPECARRALYVKVQLNEEPAWLRRGAAGIQIDLLTESTEKVSDPPTDKANQPADTEFQQAMANLALERGEKNGPIKTDNLLKDEIHEKSTSGHVIAPSLKSDVAGKSHNSVEGYTPKGTRDITDKGDTNDEDGDVDEEDAHDWKF